MRSAFGAHVEELRALEGVVPHANGAVGAFRERHPDGLLGAFRTDRDRDDLDVVGRLAYLDRLLDGVVVPLVEIVFEGAFGDVESGEIELVVDFGYLFDSDEYFHNN